MRPIAAWNRRVAAAVVAAVLLVGAIVVAAVLFAGPQAGGPPSGVSTFPSAAPTTGGTSATPTNAEQGILAAGAVLPLPFGDRDTRTIAAVNNLGYVPSRRSSTASGRPVTAS